MAGEPAKRRAGAGSSAAEGGGRVPAWLRNFARTAALVAEPVVLIDTSSGKVREVNPAFVERLRLDRALVLGRTPVEAGWLESSTTLDALARTMAGEPAVAEGTLALVGSDGQAFEAAVRAARIGPGGGHLQIVAALPSPAAEAERDIMFEHVPVGLALTRSRRFVNVNPVFARVFGWTVADLVGQPGRVVWPSDAAYEEIGRQVGPVLARGEVAELEPVEILGPDGKRRSLRLLAKAIAPRRGIDGGTLWICEDISERVRLAKTMAEARERAEAASRTKSRFLASMSHELRTPLNVIQGVVHLLRQAEGSEPQRERYLDLLGDSARSLTAVVSDVLDLSKIEAGRVVLETAPFDLHDFVRTVHASFGVLAQGRDLDFGLEIAAGVPEVVEGDVQRVRQILANFVNNAIKFTEAGSVRIVVRAGNGGAVRMEVHDTGPGFDEETRARLFQPFSQADESTTRRYGGTGLGLSICRELAALMHGDVGAVGRPGEGSTFWVELPLPASEAAPRASDFGALDAGSLEGLHVLVVEDNPVNMLICTALVEQRGARVTQAADGLQALAAVEAAESGGAPIDVVLMDLEMPVLDGVGATRRLRARFPAAAIGIVGLSAAGLASDRAEALSAGMDDFVAKPVDVRRLEKAIRRAVNRRKRGL